MRIKKSQLLNIIRESLLLEQEDSVSQAVSELNSVKDLGGDVLPSQLLAEASGAGNKIHVDYMWGDKNPNRGFSGGDYDPYEETEMRILKHLRPIADKYNLDFKPKSMQDDRSFNRWVDSSRKSGFAKFKVILTQK